MGVCNFLIHISHLYLYIQHTAILIQLQYPLHKPSFFLQKMTMQIKNPLESNLSSSKRTFSLSAFSALYRYILCCTILNHCFLCLLLVCLKSLCPILELRLCHPCKFSRIYNLHAANAARFPFCLIRLILFHICGKLFCLFYGSIRTV